MRVTTRSADLYKDLMFSFGSSLPLDDIRSTTESFILVAFLPSLSKSGKWTSVPNSCRRVDKERYHHRLFRLYIVSEVKSSHVVKYYSFCLFVFLPFHGQPLS